MKTSDQVRESIDPSWYDHGRSWTKELVDKILIPNYDWKYDELAGKFKCSCGKKCLYLKDELGTGMPDKLCFDCWEEWFNYRKELIMWKRRRKLPRNQWHLIPYPRFLFDCVTEWD